MTYGNAMFQAWQIIEGLSTEERNYISPELVNEIKCVMDPNDAFKIDVNKPLETQNIDAQAWNMLERVVKDAEKNGFKDAETKTYSESYYVGCINDLKTENARLSKEIERLNADIKNIEEKYEFTLTEANREYEGLKREYENTVQEMEKVPYFLRKIFTREKKIKLLSSGN